MVSPVSDKNPFLNVRLYDNLFAKHPRETHRRSITYHTAEYKNDRTNGRRFCTIFSVRALEPLVGNFNH